MDTVNVLVVDDSVMYRSVLSTVLNRIPDIHVTGTAPNGKLALEKLRLQHVEIVTLDIEMPVMDGIETLENIQREFPGVIVIMVSSLTRRGADITVNALEKGAFDVIAKPDEGTREQNEAFFEQQLKVIVRGIQTRLAINALNRKTGGITQKRTVQPPRSEVVETKKTRPTMSVRPDIVAIGSSTGGPNALIELIPNLPEVFPVPIVIVQHMPPVFTASLAESINKKSKLTVVEAKEGDVLKQGTVYIAPGGRQMKLSANSGGGKKITITDDPPENFCKPSVDYLFRSVAKEYAAKAMGVILTGMGSDGTIGLRLMKRHNVLVIGQNEATCVVYGMPAEAKKAGVVDIELPIREIAAEIVKSVTLHK